MIIDIHTHIGVIPNGFNMPKELLIDSMKKYKIDYSLVSNIEAAYFKPLESNIKMVEFVKENNEMLAGMIFCTPQLDPLATEKLFKQNKEYIKGIKIHPDISGAAINNKIFFSFYEMAAKYNLPVLFHTKNSPVSKVEFVTEVAEKFPKVNFILGHMDIDSSDKSEAIAALEEYDNIYADTAWVKLESIIGASKKVKQKIMFGTDAPIAGIDTYGDKEYYTNYYNKDYEFKQGILCENAKKLFKVNF